MHTKFRAAGELFWIIFPKRINYKEIILSHQEKLEAAKASLGKTYLMHPANRVKRKKPFRATANSLRSRLGDGVNRTMTMR